MGRLRSGWRTTTASASRASPTSLRASSRSTCCSRHSGASSVEEVIGDEFVVTEFDCHTVGVSDISSFSTSFRTEITDDAVLWRLVDFNGSAADPAPNPVTQRRPESTTHWAQQVFLMPPVVQGATRSRPSRCVASGSTIGCSGCRSTLAMARRRSGRPRGPSTTGSTDLYRDRGWDPLTSLGSYDLARHAALIDRPTTLLAALAPD